MWVVLLPPRAAGARGILLRTFSLAVLGVRASKGAALDVGYAVQIPTMLAPNFSALSGPMPVMV
jgi:hypothetical protein